MRTRTARSAPHLARIFAAPAGRAHRHTRAHFSKYTTKVVHLTFNGFAKRSFRLGETASERALILIVFARVPRRYLVLEP